LRHYNSKGDTCFKDDSGTGNLKLPIRMIGMPERQYARQVSGSMKRLKKPDCPDFRTGP
jgi:hypothetical protein